MGMFEDILIEPEQKELLATLVELSRKMPRDQRAKFIVAQSFGGDVLLYPGHPSGNRKIFMGDMEILAREGLIDIMYGSRGSPNINVLPRGYAYYEHMKRQAGQPLENVESSIRSYLTAENFRRKYPIAYQKWAEAEDILWGSDSENQLTTIGHLCREALQEFATALVDINKLTSVDLNKAHDVNRVSAVLNARADQLGQTEKSFLAALLEYWKMVSALIQRQEHGGQREGQPLVWEDARRVVFQTAIVMFEVERAVTN
jgi:hypothetical protein